jgi:hypothetical protein
VTNQGRTTFDERQRRRELAAVRERQRAGERWTPKPAAGRRPAYAPRAEYRVACPRNGELIRCRTCRDMVPHRVEALVRQGDRIRECEKHGVPLVIVEERQVAA